MIQFHPRLRMAPKINRWGLLPTFFPADIASISWFVALYSMQIAMRIEYKGPMEPVIAHAILHDVPEVWTGDICGPVKRRIIDKDKMAQFISSQMNSKMGALMMLSEWFGSNVHNPDEDSPVHRIVKAADILDDILFCVQELAFGNDALRTQYSGCIERLKESWWRLPAEIDLIKAAWDDVNRSIDAHRDGYQYGY